MKGSRLPATATLLRNTVAESAPAPALTAQNGYAANASTRQYEIHAIAMVTVARPKTNTTPERTAAIAVITKSQSRGEASPDAIRFQLCSWDAVEMAAPTTK